MAKAFGSKFVKLDLDKSRELQDAAAKDMGGGERQARIVFKDGMNVLWVLPMVGTMTHPMEYKMVHYNPFHLCGRGDPVDGENGKLKKDPVFKNCPRDAEAWARYEEAGKPKSGPAYDKFRQDMPVTRVLIQAVNLTPFFDSDATRNYAVPNKKRIQEWGAAFVDIINGGEAPEGIPEDIREAAEAGVDYVFVNEKLGSDMRMAHLNAQIETDEDPLISPDTTLLQVHRKDDGKSFVGRGGVTIKSKEYVVRFTLPKFMKDWVIPEGLMEAVEDKARDLRAIEPEDDTLEAKARALHKLSDAEILEYLELQKHTFSPANAEPSTSASDNGEGFEDDASTDPDSFDAGENALATKKSMAELKRSRE